MADHLLKDASPETRQLVEKLLAEQEARLRAECAQQVAAAERSVRRRIAEEERGFINMVEMEPLLLDCCIALHGNPELRSRFADYLCKEESVMASLIARALAELGRPAQGGPGGKRARVQWYTGPAWTRS